MSHYEQIRQTVTAWAGISAHPHRFGGTEFNLGRVEVGHIHGSSLVDIPFTRKLREALVREGETEAHHVLPDSGWTSFYLRREGDANQALKLLRISYLQKRLRRAGPDERQQIIQEIERLDVSLAVKDALRSPSAQDDDEGIAV